MLNTKLLTLLQNLSGKEKQAVEDYFCQPYYAQKHALLSGLLKYLFQNMDYPDKLTKPTVFHYLFAAEPYDDLKLRHLITETLQHVEQALLAYHSKTENPDSRLQLLELYRSKRLSKHYKAVSQKLETHFDRHPHRHALYYYRRFLFMQNQDLFTENRNEPQKQTFLAQASEALDVFYLANKLRMIAQMATLKKLRDTEEVILLSADLLPVIQSGNWLRYPVIAFYYHVVMMQTEPDNALHFTQLNQLFETQNQLLPPDEAREMLYFLLNYCAVKINAGNTDFLNKIYSLYELGLHTRLMMEDNFLSPWNYKNIVTVALRLGFDEQARRFLEQYSPFLPPEHRNNAYTYNMANYHFFMRHYNKVLQLLQQVSYDDVFYSLDARTLLLKTYYELNEQESLISLIDSFRQWLNRTKELNKQRQLTYRNLLYFVKKLIGLPPRNAQKRNDLINQINQTPAIADKRWLLSKTNGEW